MTDKKLTDSEIVKAKSLLKKLEEAYNAYYDTSKCMPYDIDVTLRETAICLEDCIDLINRLQEEKEALINGQETLQKYIADLQAEIKVKNKLLDIAEAKFETIKSEAYKECLKRFEKNIKDVKVTLGQTWEIQNALKKTYKEMVGDEQ